MKIKFGLYYVINNFIVLVLFVGGDWVYYGCYKEVIYLFKILSGDNVFCSDKCNRNILCNGYFIDIFINGCYFSSCISYISVLESYDCFFVSKNFFFSLNICLLMLLIKIVFVIKMVNIIMFFIMIF